mgnify:CR=1 FL=1
MRTKVQYYKNAASDVNRDEFLSRCMESSFLYAVRHYPYIERKLSVMKGLAELELWDIKHGIKFCNAKAQALDTILYISGPVELTAQVGTEYLISLDFLFFNKKHARHIARFARQTRSYEIEHSIKEHFDLNGRLYRLERVSSVKKLNAAYITGPILAYLKSGRITRT